jgi:ADP-ribose pyrophosphatase YjhB (NUDIX family)
MKKTDALRVAAWLRKRWWRVRQPTVVGVRVVVFDEKGQVLLVRHTYGRRAWYLPGGGAKRHENLAEAAARELREETGIEVTGGPASLRLHGVMTNQRERKTDHIAVFVVGAAGWTAHASSALEIADSGFFPPDQLPPETSPGTRRRLAEIAEGRTPAFDW